MDIEEKCVNYIETRTRRYHVSKRDDMHAIDILNSYCSGIEAPEEVTKQIHKLEQTLMRLRESDEVNGSAFHAFIPLCG